MTIFIGQETDVVRLFASAFDFDAHRNDPPPFPDPILVIVG